MSSFGPRAVSAVSTRMRSSETSSSSAPMRAIAVRRPWPSSTLPVRSVTRPSSSMRIQTSSSGWRARLSGRGRCGSLTSWPRAGRSRRAGRRAGCADARRSDTSAGRARGGCRPPWARRSKRAAPPPPSGCPARSRRTGRRSRRGRLPGRGGASRPRRRPSTVNTSRSPTREIGSAHDITACPPTTTVHAPHCSRPQPNFAARSPRSLRSTVRSGVSGSASTRTSRPFTRSRVGSATAGERTRGVPRSPSRTRAGRPKPRRRARVQARETL